LFGHSSPLFKAATDPLSRDKRPLTIAGTPVVAEGCPMPYVRFKQPTLRLSATLVKRKISARPLKRECAA
jgi:hypothetical protein